MKKLFKPRATEAFSVELNAVKYLVYKKNKRFGRAEYVIKVTTKRRVIDALFEKLKQDLRERDILENDPEFYI